ncbi:hypothetical protein VNO77_17337 [Canavalia gladiata]|uniref:Uncharacterized protein n=1 Tax=Canavalia gladiata TaxID=3824 RepID=A0AAN9LM99_CANGL
MISSEWKEKKIKKIDEVTNVYSSSLIEPEMNYNSPQVHESSVLVALHVYGDFSFSLSLSYMRDNMVLDCKILSVFSQIKVHRHLRVHILGKFMGANLESLKQGSNKMLSDVNFMDMNWPTGFTPMIPYHGACNDCIALDATENL